MARLNRNKTIADPARAKVQKKRRKPNSTVTKLLVLNLALTSMVIAADYDKYVQIYNNLIELLGY